MEDIWYLFGILLYVWFVVFNSNSNSNSKKKKENWQQQLTTILADSQNTGLQWIYFTTASVKKLVKDDSTEATSPNGVTDNFNKCFVNVDLTLASKISFRPYLLATICLIFLKSDKKAWMTRF